MRFLSKMFATFTQQLITDKILAYPRSGSTWLPTHALWSCVAGQALHSITTSYTKVLI